MIKFLMNGKNKSLIGLGLSKGNIDRLKKGDPIYFSLEELGIEGYDVTIMYGETQDSMKQQLKKHFTIEEERDI